MTHRYHAWNKLVQNLEGRWTAGPKVLDECVPWTSTY